MKIKLSELRRLVNEEYTRGVSEWQLQQATDKYIEMIKEHLVRSIVSGATHDQVQLKEKLDKLDDMLNNLRDSVVVLMEEKLVDYLQQI